jgi:O-acetyl-ADP-ribose deacetylase (regulator of RNase III)
MKIIVEKADLTELEVDAVVNPANSSGRMGGGVAGAIKRRGGKSIEKDAVAQAPIPVGEAVITQAGKMKANFVIHAPTMKKPTQKTDRDQVFRATAAAMKLAQKKGLLTVAFPGMGTGVGKVAPEDAAGAMVEAIRAHWGELPEVVYLVDLSEDMVKAFQKAVS